MLRSFLVLATSVVSALAYVPFDLPAELFTDVNKGAPYDVNIIADRAAFIRSPAVAGLESQIKAAHPAESMAMIHQTLSDAVQAAALAEGIPVDDVLCSKNYSGCPSGWASMGSDCLAPVNYSGSCGKSVSFSGLAPFEKAGLAQKCDASFPCM